MKKFLSLVLALVMTMSLVTISAGAKDFTDADKVTYTEAVDVLSAVKVVDGYTDGAFKPTTQLNRGQAAKILCNLILGPTTAGALVADAAPYKDVPADSTFAAYIAYCAKEGIIDGYTDGTFRPTAPLTGYAFMKLLLGALGYDKDVEGYNGANWSINVAKRALNIGLDKGLTDDFNGVKPVTREEAALFAFNALKADMVEYDAKTTVSVGGADVVIAGSAAKPVDNKATTETISNDDVMQFAEKYFSKLVLTKNITDDFARPAHKWTNKNDKIGTYCDTPDLTYTDDVKLGTIYSDLDLDDQIDATVYRNGKKGSAADNQLADVVAISRGNTDKLGTDVGTLVEVYYSADKATIKIVVVDTYVGEIATVKAATAAKDAYVVVSESRAPSPIDTDTDEFETEEKFEVEDVVLYTFSESAKEIKSVVKAEKIEGTLNTIYLDSKVTIDGTKYSLAENIADDTSDTTKLSVKSSYVAYLDPYGNVIDMDESEYVSGDYAFVYDAKTQAGTSWSDYEAKLVYLDGTTGRVTTDKNYASDGALDYATNYYLVTYKTNSDNDVVLKKVAGQGFYPNSKNFKMVSGDAEILINDDDQDGAYTDSATEQRVFANSKSIIVVRTVDALGRVKHTAYTGVKNMPTITGTATYPVDMTWYCKGTNSKVLSYAFINVDARAVTGSSDKVYFLAAESISKHTTDTDVADYYTFNAVVNGEITTVRVDATADYVNDGVNDDAQVVNETFNVVTFDRDGIITDLDVSGSFKKDTSTTITKLSGEHTLGFDQGYYTVADDCAVYFVDPDGEITAGTVNMIATQTTRVNYVLNSSWEVTHVFIQEQEDGEAGEVATSTTFSLGNTPVYTLSAASGVGVGTAAKIKVNGSYPDADVAVKVTVDVKAYVNGVWTDYTTVTCNAAGDKITKTTGALAFTTGDMGFVKGAAYKVTITVSNSTNGSLVVYDRTLTAGA